MPSAEEENFVFQLLSRLLRPELERIKDHVSGNQPMSRCEYFCFFFFFVYPSVLLVIKNTVDCTEILMFNICFDFNHVLDEDKC